jgi:hypothetical protein
VKKRLTMVDQTLGPADAWHRRRRDVAAQDEAIENRLVVLADLCKEMSTKSNDNGATAGRFGRR